MLILCLFWLDLQVHRDIKLENFLYETKVLVQVLGNTRCSTISSNWHLHACGNECRLATEDSDHLKLIDFGFSSPAICIDIFEGDKQHWRRCGCSYVRQDMAAEYDNGG